MIRVHHYTTQDGTEVCKYCGKARNPDRAHPEYCSGKLPPTEQRIARPARPGQDTPKFYAEAYANPMAWQRFCEIARSGARVGTGALIDRWV